ncbi:von Willebrand factor type A domain-containing protein [candidate division KSB1 bacterium]|nr:von Willebrand factor type A domain-containing protein [candidate division KSB1 bacterium]
MKHKIIILLFIPVLFCAAKTGTITGRVTDKETTQPLTGVNILLVGTSLGAATDSLGNYKIENVPAGVYDLKFQMIGYRAILVTGVKVKAKKTVKMSAQMSPSVLDASEMEVIGKRPRPMKREKTLAEVSYMMAIESELQPDFNTEEYSKITESGFFEVLKNPLSTFAADVDAASYANARRFILQDQLPYKDVIRTEEFVNYFNYSYPQPQKEHPLSITLEYSTCPWEPEHHLVHIGIKGKELSESERGPSNLVFLLDVSGSMNDPKKLPLLKKAFNLLVDKLGPSDRVAIVVYAGAAGLVLPSTPASEKATVKSAIEGLNAGGSTAGGQGIQLAYKVAKENFIKDGNNRVILATDGDFNVGISSTSELVRTVEEKRDLGIFLTVLGFGMGNYKDDRLQELADRGNGNHAYIDNIMEAQKVLVNDLTATLFTIAKDVKIQVEFNPTKVFSYRLIGYENRKLADKDFEDDTKDAGEVGAGHTVTALYELVPADPSAPDQKYDLKYQQTTVKKDAEKTDEVLTVRIRYKAPDGKKSTSMSEILTGEPLEIKRTSDNFRFSAVVAEFAHILRDSEYKGSASLQHVKEMAKGAMGDDPFGYRREFLDLVERVQILLDSQK